VTTQRVSGHELRNEGAPFDARRHRIGIVNRTSGEGRGLCSCGALSDVLGSGSKRKAWHREHKSEQLQLGAGAS